MRISIGGSIGSGKSTILDMLKKNGYDVFFEPIDEWKHMSNFYRDKKRWSFTFQVEVLQSFMQCDDSESMVICERSPWESYNIFCKMLVENGDITPSEAELFKKLYDTIAWKPDVFIYLHTRPEVCYERIQKRNRACEKDINMSYLYALHDKYENTYSRGTVRVDANRSIQHVYEDIIKILKQSSTQ